MAVKTKNDVEMELAAALEALAELEAEHLADDEELARLSAELNDARLAVVNARSGRGHFGGLQDLGAVVKGRQSVVMDLAAQMRALAARKRAVELADAQERVKRARQAVIDDQMVAERPEARRLVRELLDALNAYEKAVKNYVEWKSGLPPAVALDYPPPPRRISPDALHNWRQAAFLFLKES
jgi:hypothetical protein